MDGTDCFDHDSYWSVDGTDRFEHDKMICQWMGQITLYMTKLLVSGQNRLL